MSNTATKGYKRRFESIDITHSWMGASSIIQMLMLPLNNLKFHVITTTILRRFLKKHSKSIWKYIRNNKGP